MAPAAVVLVMEIFGLTNGGSGAQGIIIITYTTPSTPPSTYHSNNRNRKYYALCFGQTITLTPNLPQEVISRWLVQTECIYLIRLLPVVMDFQTPYSITGARMPSRRRRWWQSKQRWRRRRRRVHS